MALTYGFYDAKYDSATDTWDRTYNAETMSSLFDGIINDGVFLNYKDAFAVKGVSGISNCVSIGSGRCWFDHTWTANEYAYNLILSSPPSTTNFSRIDALYLKVDKKERVNSIVVVKGTETSGTPEVPSAPTVASSDKNYIFYHPFYQIVRDANVTDLTKASIAPMYDVCTLTSATVSLDDLISNWWNILVKDTTSVCINSRYFYGTSSTVKSKSTKVAYCWDDLFTLQKGVVIRVYFDNDSGTPTTLCVNQTGARNIVYNTWSSGYRKSVDSSAWVAGDIVTFIFTGDTVSEETGKTIEGNWVIMDDWNQISNIESNIDALKQSLQDILNKIQGGGTINSNGSITWGDSTGYIPTGTINITSGSGYIRCHSNTNKTNDLKAT